MPRLERVLTKPQEPYANHAYPAQPKSEELSLPQAKARGSAITPSAEQINACRRCGIPLAIKPCQFMLPRAARQASGQLAGPCLAVGAEACGHLRRSEILKTCVRTSPSYLLKISALRPALGIWQSMQVTPARCIELPL